MLRFTSNSETETFAIAASLAKKLHPPQVILLTGDLGAGKTAFTRGFVKSLPSGSAARVKSPTYAYALTYPTVPPVHHLDLYRCADENSAQDLGLLEYLEDDGSFTIIEWPGILRDSLPKNCIRVHIASDSEQREITFYP